MVKGVRPMRLKSVASSSPASARAMKTWTGSPSLRNSTSAPLPNGMREVGAPTPCAGAAGGGPAGADDVVGAGGVAVGVVGAGAAGGGPAVADVAGADVAAGGVGAVEADCAASWLDQANAHRLSPSRATCSWTARPRG